MIQTFNPVRYYHKNDLINRSEIFVHWLKLSILIPVNIGIANIYLYDSDMLIMWTTKSLDVLPHSLFQVKLTAERKPYFLFPILHA